MDADCRDNKKRVASKGKKTSTLVRALQPPLSLTLWVYIHTHAHSHFLLVHSKQFTKKKKKKKYYSCFTGRSLDKMDGRNAFKVPRSHSFSSTGFIYWASPNAATEIQ